MKRQNIKDIQEKLQSLQVQEKLQQVPTILDRFLIRPLVWLWRIMNMSQETTLDRLLRHIGSMWWILIFSILARLCNQLCSIAILTMSIGAIGRIVLQPGSDPMSYMMIVLVILGALKGIFHYLEKYLGYYVSLHLVARLRDQLYARLELLAPAGLAQMRSGDLISRAIADIDRVELFYAQTLAPVIVAAFLLIASLCIMAWFHIVLALIFLPFLVLVGGAIPWYFGRRSIGDSLTLRNTSSEVSAYLIDSIQGLREIVVFGDTEQRQNQLRQFGKNQMKLQGRLIRIAGRQDAITDLAAAVCLVLLLGMGLGLASLGQMEFVDLPTALALAIITFNVLPITSTVVHAFNEAMSSAERLFSLMDQPPVVQEKTTLAPVRPLETSIEFENVVFRYPSRDLARNGKQPDMPELVHNALSFTIPAGRTVALVGSSGVGKTTVVNLLLRFWDVSQGSIRIGGVDIRDLPLDELRRKFAVVPQNTYIFNASIKDNLLIGKPRAKKAEIEQSTRNANIHDFIMSLPEGYNTRVGEMGVRLSGGQRQRLAIARALLKDAPILILDEATSNLDAVSEREIQSHIQELMQGRTILIIAHRLSTVIHADEILVLDNGRIVERGNHAELTARNGVYARLFSTQQDSGVLAGVSVPAIAGPDRAAEVVREHRSPTPNGHTAPSDGAEKSPVLVEGSQTVAEVAAPAVSEQGTAVPLEESTPTEQPEVGTTQPIDAEPPTLPALADGAAGDTAQQPQEPPSEGKSWFKRTFKNPFSRK